MVNRKNFYKKADSRKRVLKQTIRPTHAKVSVRAEPEPEDEHLEETPFFPVTLERSSKKPLSHKSSYKSTPEVIAETSAADEEIARISEMIQQASAKIKELEEKKRIQEEEARQTQMVEVEEFDGADEDDQRELLTEQLEQYRAQNSKLKNELKTLKLEFEKEKTKFEKELSRIKKEVDKPSTVQDNKFFSFSSELQDAIKAIQTLQDPDFKPIASEVVVKADEMPSAQVATQLTEVVPPAPPAANPPVATPPPPATSPAPTEALPTAASPAPAPDPEAAAKKSKEKKLLITGVTVLAVLVGGGGLSYAVTSKPKVDNKLVEEYLANNPPSQVLGAQSPKAVVPEGVVADKNSDATYDETHWANYEDPVLGISMKYAANVTERLHTSNSITYMRKDSYIFKINKYTTDLDLEAYWEQNKDKGVAYQAEPVTYSNRPALYLQLQELVEYPGDRYLVATDDAIYDIWFATDPSVFGADDVRRAKDMKDSVRFIN